MRGINRMDSVQTEHRKTITVEPEVWQKYCQVKSVHLRKMGKPELTFTEFANLSVMLASVTYDDILQYRKQRNQK